MTDITVTDIAEFIEATGRKRHEGHGPSMFIIGLIERSIEVDGTVISRIGQVDGYPAYELHPRAYVVVEDGAIELLDAHPDWLEAGNDEEERIDNDDIVLCLITSPDTDELVTPASATNVVLYPEKLDHT